jgi:hypothetical protein
MATKNKAGGKGKMKPTALVHTGGGSDPVGGPGTGPGPNPGPEGPRPPGKPKKPTKKKTPIASKPAQPVKASAPKGKTGSVYKKTKTKSAAV